MGGTRNMHGEIRNEKKFNIKIRREENTWKKQTYM